jgi:hypothetical protein
MTSQSPGYHGYRFPPEISQSRRLALSPLWSQLPRCGGSVGSARRHGHRRDDSAVVSDLRAVVCANAAAPPRANGRHVVSGRTVRHDPRAAAVSLAGRRRGRRRDQHPCAVPARFFRKLLKRQGSVPRRLITDKLRSYASAIELKSPISRRASASARCGASSRPPRCNASRPCPASYRISSGWADSCSGRLTTGCYEGKRSGSGMP